MKKLVKNLDNIALIPSQRFHFGNPNSHKTTLGGCCTIFAYFCVVLYAVYQWEDIWNQTYPFTSTQEKSYPYDSVPSELFHSTTDAGAMDYGATFAFASPGGDTLQEID